MKESRPNVHYILVFEDKCSMTDLSRSTKDDIIIYVLCLYNAFWLLLLEAPISAIPKVYKSTDLQLKYR